MEWADVVDFPYRLVTTYENSHACKPNLLYFELIMEAIGHRADECLVVGDDDMDMVAARLGCDTFYVSPSGPESKAQGKLDSTTPEPTYRGTLADLGVLLESWR